MAGNQHSSTIVIGAGQAGLAVAGQLRERGVGCRILESGASPGHSWAERWDSLRLFTPAQYCSLPGRAFPAARGSLPTKDQVARYLRDYAAGMDISAGVAVTGMRRHNAGFELETTAGPFTAAQVVVATGATSAPFIPALSASLAPAIRQLHSSEYRNPAALPEGSVLVVGAATSGLEIAMELARDRQVWLAGRVPFHVPDAVLAHAGGLYWQFIHKVLTRRTPLGRKIAADFTKQGGPLISVSAGDAFLAGVRRLPRLEAVDDAGRPVFADGPALDVSTVVWATGYRPDYRWIDGVKAGGLETDGRRWPVTDRGGVPTVPGLYFVGLPFQYGLTSTLLGGVGRDAAHVADLIAKRPRQRSAATTAAS